MHADSCSTCTAYFIYLSAPYDKLAVLLWYTFSSDGYVTCPLQQTFLSVPTASEQFPMAVLSLR